MRAPDRLGSADRVVMALAAKFDCRVSAETERRIRGDERARIVERLKALGIVAVSRQPSRRRLPAQSHPDAEALEREVRRDERLLMIRELRREARMSFASARDADLLEAAAARLESGAL
jgi:hypothetical protein